MNTNSLVSIVSLASAAAVMNLSWVAEGRISIPSKNGQACEVGMDSGEWIESWMPPQGQLDPLAGGCEGCRLDDTVTQYYCESRGTDCDGLLGPNESYKWTRTKYIYECGTAGQPGYGWFVECSTWVGAGCCDDGFEGLPPAACDHYGASECSTRND